MDEFKKIQEKLPKRFNLPQKVADRLNAKGVKSLFGKEYKYHAVRKTQDANCINEALDILKEYQSEQKKVSIKAKRILNENLS